MSKEAMKLALEALVKALPDMPVHTDWHLEAITALREALAEQPAQQDSTCSNALRIQGKAYPRTCKKCGLGPCVELAQQALDKMAENARELGLDYEPAQQEPVAWMDGYRNIYSLEEKAAGCPEATIALVPMANHKKTSGSPIKELNCICGAVWEGDELVHLPRPPAQREWVGLTKQEFNECVDGLEDLEDCWTAIEAKLKEKNT